MRPRLLLLLALVAATIAGVAILGTRAPGRPDVVLVVIDTLRASHLGAYGYRRPTTPFLDAFAERNVRVERAIAAAPWTAPSIASIFASVYPPVHGIHMTGFPDDITGRLALDEGFSTLAEILSRNGYETLAVVANPWIREELGFSQGFDHFHTVFTREGWRSHSKAASVTETVGEALAGRDREEDPLFLYVHYMDPHMPYEPPPEFARMFRGAEPGHAFSDMSDPETAAQIDAYDGAIRYLDSELEKLFGLLDDDAIVVITSDHGEQIFEYGDHAHGFTVHNLEVHVPLLMRIPGMRGVVLDGIASTIDILPTILDAAGIEIQHPIQGFSLLSEFDRRREAGVYAGMTYSGNEKSFTRGDGMKVIISYDAPPAAIVRKRAESDRSVYDTKTDYAEKKPRKKSPQLKQLRERLYVIYNESIELGKQIQPEPVELSSEAVEQLRELGYVE